MYNKRLIELTDLHESLTSNNKGAKVANGIKDFVDVIGETMLQVAAITSGPQSGSPQPSPPYHISPHPIKLSNRIL